MKKKILLSICFLVGVLIAFPSICKATNDMVSFKIEVTEDYESAIDVVNMVNKERKAIGLNELKIDKDLMDVAMLRASELSLYFSHTRPNGKSCFTASPKINGENAAAGQSSPEFAMKNWMASQGHKDNILDASYTTIGVGAIVERGICYWIQLFGIGNENPMNSDSLVNKNVTRTIEMAPENIVLYNNSSTSYYKEMYKDGMETRIVILNKGWRMVCRQIEPKDLIFSSTNKQIPITKDGIIKANMPGTTTITVALKQNPSISVSTDITAISMIHNQKIQDIKDIVYTGKSITPNVVIKDKNYTLVKDKDYKLSYSNNKECGTATVTITGIGYYSGEITKDFKIIPPKVTGVELVTTSSNSINIKWKKMKNVTGYKVYIYNASKNEYQHYKTIGSNEIKIKNLNPNTQYKFKVKAYKEINGVQYSGPRSDRFKTITSPKKVTNIQTSWTKNNMIKVNWDKVSGTTKYKVYIYDNNKNKYQYYGETKYTSIKIKNLQPNTKYKIKVEAYRKYEGKQHVGDRSKAFSVKTKNEVYRTPKGEKYHLDSNCGGKNSYKITLNKAKSQGLTPCKKCAK